MARTIPLKLKYRVPKIGGNHTSAARTGSAKKVKMKQGSGPRKRAYGPF